MEPAIAGAETRRAMLCTEAGKSYARQRMIVASGAPIAMHLNAVAKASNVAEARSMWTGAVADKSIETDSPVETAAMLEAYGIAFRHEPKEK